MEKQRYLVIGATGHVGSKVAILLADRGHDVTAMVRKPDAKILDAHQGYIKYVVGDLNDEVSIANAVRGVDVVVSTANGVVPQAGGGDAGGVNERALRLIDLCEEAGVRRFIQSSVPPFKHENRVPELRGKRMIEARLQRSSMQTFIVRNPAFMDVWLVYGGFKQAADRSTHATTARQYGFGKVWLGLIGNLVVRHGAFLAPGGSKHGSAMIATRDVAELMYAGATYKGTDNRLIEVGGPEWLTWRQITDIVAQKVGRKHLRILPTPAWMARMNQLIAWHFSRSVANTFALLNFVASHQPRWEAAKVVEELGVPRQLTVSDYLDERMEDWKKQLQNLPPAERTSPLDNRIPPPLVTLFIGAAMWFVSFLRPALHLIHSIRIGGGATAAGIGLGILATGFMTFARARTTIDPVQIDRASSLVTGGIFRITRNPMYVGFAAILLGWALFLASPLAALGPIVFVLFTTRFQIVPEERTMRFKFGLEYELYWLRVRRWI